MFRTQERELCNGPSDLHALRQASRGARPSRKSIRSKIQSDTRSAMRSIPGPYRSKGAVAVDVEVDVGHSRHLVVARVNLPCMSAELVDEVERVVGHGVRVGVDGREVDLVAALLAADEVGDQVRGARDRI